MNTQNIPIIINSKNRLSCVKQLITRLELANLSNIIIMDTGTTYEPLLEYYNTLPYQIIKLGGGNHLALWDLQVINKLDLLESPIVYTDSDVIPTEYCPNDFLQYMWDLLQKYPDIPKVGFGLKIDDLPDHYLDKESVVGWESQFWKDEIEPHNYRAPIDTTFALYRKGSTRGWAQAIRTGEPYVAHHTTWYSDTNNLSEEDKYYTTHLANGVCHWSRNLWKERTAEMSES